MDSNRNIKARNKEFEITDPEEPFKDDKLGRKPYGVILTDIVGTLNDGAVIALNGAWGTGKTTFLRMWGSHLVNQHFKVVYYNAWEDDICDEPLMSMLRGMKELQEGEKLDDLFKIGAKVLVGALSGALVAATGVFGKVAKGAVEGGMKQLEDSVYESLKEDDGRMKLMQSFKESLTDYLTTVCHGSNENKESKPLVFMVDELDRCNPSFAVKVLERIKHLFDVPGVVFVLAVDKKQLACSVKGFYGNNEIDADEYLRRFVDYDYYLPEPNAEQFCDYLYDYYRFDDFLKSEWRIGIDYTGQKKAKAQQDKDILLFMAKLLVKQKHLSLRQIERIFSTARIGLCGVPINSEFLPQLFFLLSYLKICEPELFDKIANCTMGLQDYVDAMEDVITIDIMNEDVSHYLMAMALSCYYHGYLVYMRANGQVINLKGKDSKLTVKFKRFNEEAIDKCLAACQINNQSCDIRYLTRRLMLLEQIIHLPPLETIEAKVH